SEHHHDTMNTKPCPPPADRASPCRYKLTSNDAYMLTANAAQQPSRTTERIAHRCLTVTPRDRL
ncbi:hypothetical protein, partial [Catellatospora sichuanensis]|uniref:hypothetical protein n=1 Tax=Catellatospora sichuanensis TaxID=1969805 RepID=UPI001C922082